MTDHDFPECVPVVRDLRAFHFGRYREPSEAEASQPEPKERREKPLRQPNPAYEAPPLVVNPLRVSGEPKVHGPSKSEQQVAREIRDRMAAGESAETIAAELKIAKRSVYNKLYRCGLDVPPNKCATCGIACGAAHHCSTCYPAYKRAQMREKYAERKGATA